MKKLWPPKDGMFAPECNQTRREISLRILLFCVFPLMPTYLIVLAVGIVVSTLCAPVFISRTNHRNALRLK